MKFKLLHMHPANSCNLNPFGRKRERERLPKEIEIRGHLSDVFFCLGNYFFLFFVPVSPTRALQVPRKDADAARPAHNS